MTEAAEKRGKAVQPPGLSFRNFQPHYWERVKHLFNFATEIYRTLKCWIIFNLHVRLLAISTQLHLYGNYCVQVVMAK